jgi:sugar (pentulose or hexulose) kinase
LALVLGLDVGTQGVRAVACDQTGEVLARAAASFPQEAASSLPPGHAEQAPLAWWEATISCLRQVTAALAGQPLAALAVTSTSGTVCLLDGEGQPLLPALMYNDARSVAEAEEVQSVGGDLAAKLGYRFNASFALAKLLWLKRNRPGIFDSARYLAHAADYIAGQLTGEYGLSDYSNALKTGYDLLEERWPPFIETSLGIPLERLPRVVPPGTPIGALSARAAEETGLPVGLAVVAGMTDGCASQVAAGAVRPGDWHSSLGTTLVVKGVTSRLLLDPPGRIYSHKHPDGYWLPGGASNTGGEVLAARFPGADLAALDRQALAKAPTDLVVYPLVRKGERFPFVRPGAEGFTLGATGDEATFYAACLEGVGYLERLAYEMLAGLGAEVGPTLSSGGGGARSLAWLQLRADILGRAIVRPVETGASFGAAIVAASRTLYATLSAAAQEMVRIDCRVEPRPAVAARYREMYHRFRRACAERGYIEE